jgi:hypothetical protein
MYACSALVLVRVEVVPPVHYKCMCVHRLCVCICIYMCVCVCGMYAFMHGMSAWNVCMRAWYICMHECV